MKILIISIFTMFSLNSFSIERELTPIHLRLLNLVQKLDNKHPEDESIEIPISINEESGFTVFEMVTPIILSNLTFEQKKKQLRALYREPIYDSTKSAIHWCWGKPESNEELRTCWLNKIYEAIAFGFMEYGDEHMLYRIAFKGCKAINVDHQTYKCLVDLVPFITNRERSVEIQGCLSKFASVRNFRSAYKCFKPAPEPRGPSDTGL